MAPGSAPHPIPIRIQALTLVSAGMPHDAVGACLRMSPRTVRAIQKKAKDRGFDPAVDMKIEMRFVEDGKRTGRPKKDRDGEREGKRKGGNEVGEGNEDGDDDDDDDGDDGGDEGQVVAAEQGGDDAKD